MADADRHLLFGLLALQVGLIEQAQLVAAFQAWTRDKGRPLADHLQTLGHLDDDQRGLLEGLAAQHLKKHGGDARRGLATVPADRSTREGLASLADPQIDASLIHQAASGQVDARADVDRTATYSVGAATSDGQRFHLLRPHARGGLGAVFVALDSELNREVALKQILDHHADDPASRRRFLLEAEITGGLEHPGVVPVYGLGAHADGRPYYAMRFIRGDSLKEAIDHFHRGEAPGDDPGRRSLELRKLLRRFTDVCNAIEYAHGRGVLHRDLKPSNVVLGKHGETLVVDWGLAKAVGGGGPGDPGDERPLVPSAASGSAETLPGSALGTPAYMSPEQAAGDLDGLGPRSDVYSLGATLYCLLTGKPPFEGDEPGAVLRRVQRGELPPPRSLDPTIDPALEAICLKAMARQPKDRYDSCRSLAEDIERWMADEPVAAWREPLSRRARRWARRNRTAVTTGAVAVLVALAGTATVLWVQTQANRDLSQANNALAASITRERKAYADLANANATVVQANEREQQKSDLALEAIRRFHTNVSGDFLLQQDQFKDLRDRLLRDAVVFYRKLEGLLADHLDVRSRRAVARAYEEVGDLVYTIGSHTEALQAHQHALDVRRAIAAEDQADDDTKVEVGRSLIAIGWLLCRSGHDGQALASFAEARMILSEVTGPGTARDEAEHEMARGYWCMGMALLQGGGAHEALAAFEQGISIEEALLAARPDRLDSRRILSWCYLDAGNVLVKEGRYTEGLRAYEHSRQIKQKLADDHPDVDEFRRDVAIDEGNIAIALREMERYQDALEGFRKAQGILQGLAAKYPAHSPLQANFAYSLIENGDMFRLAGDRAEAEKFYRRAIEGFRALIAKNSTATEYRERLIQALRGLGATQLADHRFAEAVATLHDAVAIDEDLKTQYDEPLYSLAGCHALLGEAARAPGSGLSAEDGQVELDRAMDTLKKAVAAGYRSATWMRRDPILDSLKGRPDFQLLVMDLTFPADPFERGPGARSDRPPRPDPRPYDEDKAVRARR
jgi:serine/threonine protein kinase